MKRKNIILALLSILVVLMAAQSCKKDDAVAPKTFVAFDEPTAVTPTDGQVIKITGTALDLKWAAAGNNGLLPVSDIYFGTASRPSLVKSANSTTAYNVTVVPGLTYYWKVTVKDANGVMTYGPTWSFTVYDPMSIFVGSYLVDEPAEGWSYVITISKKSSSSLTIGTGGNSITAGAGDGWWASWAATFTVDLTANTYSMPKTSFGGGYYGQESGTINQTTGKLVGTYTVWSGSSIIEQGTHTYTKR